MVEVCFVVGIWVVVYLCCLNLFDIFVYVIWYGDDIVGVVMVKCVMLDGCVSLWLWEWDFQIDQCLWIQFS